MVLMLPLVLKYARTSKFLLPMKKGFIATKTPRKCKSPDVQWIQLGVHSTSKVGIDLLDPEDRGECHLDVNSPEDVKRIPESQLNDLCKELRRCFMLNAEAVGGHYSSSLGVVELTVALHRVFDSPKDRIVWDIGHQGYIHKMLTGRLHKMQTMRQCGGLSGFLRRYESPHDLFGAGHSSTSIGALQGIYEGDVITGQSSNRSYVCVIGDGSLTGGMAMEALNYTCTIKSPLLIIYNDNEQSSLPTGMPAKNGTGPVVPYFMVEGSRKPAISGHDAIAQCEALRHKNDDMPLFIGPIDGHNIEALLDVLAYLKEELSANSEDGIKRPVVLHVKTIKGMGCEKALQSPSRLHSLKVATGPKIGTEATKTFSEIFTESLIDLAEKDQTVLAITAGMPGSTGVGKMGMKFPNRTFDVGIAEQHAVTFAAGTTISGAKPFCCIYSTFMQRALDQVIHDVSLQHLPVRFVLDRAGYVGGDGASHHGIYDIIYLRMMYNMLLMAPSNGIELKMMMQIAYNTDKQPSAIRYPNGNVASHDELTRLLKYTPGEIEDPASMILPNGKLEARMVRRGKSGVAVLAFGPIVIDILKAVDAIDLDATVVDMRFLNPMDTDMLNYILQAHHTVFTAEDGVEGGFGSAVLEYFAKRPERADVMCIAYPKEFMHHGSIAEQKRLAKMDVEGLAERMRQFLAS
ncbi:1-deoxy-D-xylulose-5-phosphate synthase family protein [Babesia bovis T2Bo]|uniref:1-deoxy-D-xylulose-5-phosphate synthase n=1 Tax=Babesia bovis TaxID=5865 RepID=A7AMP1_BABBO|nr:1-deoxy-D-xylulose-5-phosphate synthase family protein [Babesia bovis T2Bo]EDO07825.1 1-deoxy-D-xylulose-5-phosphate synthase family protein [Babesia bovis T2Bo]|eukprot:XP_001611393.1 1-deoxy-D-xylulose-5-phosphate synthase family protein [Babesia bovis T2Bo]